MEIPDNYSFPFKPWPFLASMASQENKIRSLITLFEKYGGTFCSLYVGVTLQLSWGQLRSKSYFSMADKD